MKEREVSAVVNANPDKGIPEQLSTNFTYALPETVAEYVEWCGEEVAKSILDQQTIIKVQAGARSHLVKGKSQEEIQTWANGFKPGVAPERKSKADKASELIDTMSEEEAKALLVKVRDRLAARK